MLTRGDDDPQSRAGVDVDVRIHAALADQPKRGQAFEQRRTDLGSLPEQHQHLERPQALGERLELLNMVVENGHVMRRQLLEARQRPQRVEVVVEDRDLHRVTIPLAVLAVTGRPAPHGAARLSAFEKCPPQVSASPPDTRGGHMLIG